MLQITDQGHIVTVKISGRFDFRMIKEFQRALAYKPRTWLVDMSAVSYVDSSALGMLLLLRERVNGETERVQLRGLRGQPRDVLTMAKFDTMFGLI